MKNAPFMILGSVAIAMLPSPSYATSEQDLNRAYQLLNTGHYLEARDLARDYLRTNGPRFSAAFMVALAECMLHPHQPSNSVPFQQLRVNYFVSPQKNSEITRWMQRCSQPAPPPPPSSEPGIGVSTSGLSIAPDMSAARPAEDEPSSRRPAPIMVSPVLTTIPKRPLAIISKPAFNFEQCVQGYVWREAFPGDHVCVTPETRAQAADDNGKAESRRDPSGPYGPNTCVQGFVWRDARLGDVVCTTPERRAQAVVDNEQATARRVH